MIPELFYLSREASRESEDGSSNSGVEPSRLLADFVGGLGPGQVAGRQALGAGSLGELQITLEVATFLRFYSNFATNFQFTWRFSSGEDNSEF